MNIEKQHKINYLLAIERRGGWELFTYIVDILSNLNPDWIHWRKTLIEHGFTPQSLKMAKAFNLITLIRSGYIINKKPLTEADQLRRSLLMTSATYNQNNLKGENEHDILSPPNLF